MSRQQIPQHLVAIGVALIALLIGSASAGAVPSPPGSPAPQTIKKAIWGPDAIDGRSLFPDYRDLGIGIWETSVLWSSVAAHRPADPTDPDDPAYVWPSNLGPDIAAAAANGIQVSIMILGTPAWANGGRGSRWVPDNPQDYANFATAIARRYPTVHLWMIWGEPNRAPNFAPFTAAPPRGPLTAAEKVAPHNYAELLDAAYGALKAVNPDNLVVGGNTYTSAGPGCIHPIQWIKNLRLPDGRRPRMDMYGHNPFGFREPDLHDPPSGGGQVDFSDLGRFAKALDRNFPGRHLPLFLSEYGVPAGRNDKDLEFHVSFHTQAKWIEAAYGIARRWKRIYTLGWAHSVDTVRSPQGLFDVAGNRKPGYYAFRAS